MEGCIGMLPSPRQRSRNNSLCPHSPIPRLTGVMEWLTPKPAGKGLKHPKLRNRFEDCGRGWADAHVDPMATLLCAMQTPEWHALWAITA